VKYTIFGIALALSLGARAQAASPIAVDPGTTGGETQATSPAAIDPSTTGGQAEATNPVAVDLQAGTTGGETQAASPVAVDLQAGTTGGETQPASPVAVDLHAGATSGETQAASRLAVELHAGTSGVGAQVEYVFNDYFTGRVSGDWLRVSASFNTIDLNTVDIAYSGRANWATAGAFVDLHPLKNGWFVSAGVFQGDRNGSFAGAPTNDVIIDGVTFTPAQIGTVMGEAKLPSTSPFVGAGWDQAQHARSGLTFRFLAGAAFGAPQVSLWDVGPYSDTVPVQTWIAQEQADAQSKANAWKAYPVVQLGIGYRF
jgi:hypothetical protein